MLDGYRVTSRAFQNTCFKRKDEFGLRILKILGRKILN